MSVGKATQHVSMKAVLERLNEAPEVKAHKKRPIKFSLGKVTDGEVTKTLVWSTRDAAAIEVTKKGGGWIRCDLIHGNRREKAWEEFNARLGQHDRELGGGPPQVRSIGYEEAARQLEGLDPAKVLETFDRELPVAVKNQPEVG